MSRELVNALLSGMPQSALGAGGASPIQPIVVHPYQPTAGTYQGGPQHMLAQRESNPGNVRGGGNLGGSAIGSGLNQLGAGIAQAAEAWAAKRAAQQADLAAASAASLNAPSSFGVHPAPSASRPSSATTLPAAPSPFWLAYAAVL